MSFGKSKSKTSGTTTQNQTQTSNLTDWSKNQWEGQVKGIQDATAAYTSKPFNPYTNPMVADLSPMEQQARDLANGSVGNWQGSVSDAEAAINAGIAYDPSNVSKYYNPFEQDVVNSIGTAYDENLAQQLNQQRDAATMRGQLFGARGDIGEAELRRGALNDKAAALANLKYSGFRDAVNTGFQDAANKYQGASALSGLAGQKQQLAQGDVSMLAQLGATDREIENAKLLAQRAEFDRQAEDELNKFLLDLQVRQGILASTPLSSTTTSSGTGTTSGTTSESGFKFAPSFSFGPLQFGAGG